MASRQDVTDSIAHVHGRTRSTHSNCTATSLNRQLVVRLALRLQRLLVLRHDVSVRRPLRLHRLVVARGEQQQVLLVPGHRLRAQTERCLQSELCGSRYII